MKKSCFINPYLLNVRRSFWDILLWKCGYWGKEKSLEEVPLGFCFPWEKKEIDLEAPSAQWINHSTFWIKCQGVSLLTDPIWSKRCSPCLFVGPKRTHLPGIAWEELSQVDYVLISHNHYDHLDRKTVEKLFTLFPHIIWIVPLGVKKWFEKRGIKHVVEFRWWEKQCFSLTAYPGQELRVTAVPAQHFSGRGCFDTNGSLWTGWVVEFLQGQEVYKRLYFVGDTGYNTYDFKTIGKRWSHMDLSLIPIGAYLPRKLMSPIHIDPQEAVRIHREVKSRLSIGMHWKTFNLADEGGERPPYDLYRALEQQGVDPASFLVVEPGDELNW